MARSKIAKAVERLFLRGHIIQVAEDAGAMARGIIDQRTRRGEFLGGKFQNKGYSETPLPLSWLTSVRKFNYKKNDVFTITTKEGRVTTFLDGGYKKFRELTDRETGWVNHDFSGAMLNSLTVYSDYTGDAISVIVSVPSGQMEKAFHTDQMREWLNLSDEEAEQVLSLIHNKALND
jgi:hypothetical protein